MNPTGPLHKGDYGEYCVLVVQQCRRVVVGKVVRYSEARFNDKINVRTYRKSESDRAVHVISVYTSDC